MTVQELSSTVHDAPLGIDGLCFEPNVARALSPLANWFDLKVNSSPGPLVSDFVTHGPEFEYSTLGIHVGQDDRLTFFGEPDRWIEGVFVDCRDGSPTLHKEVRWRFAPSPYRRLIIPRGVAHTFDGLAGITTRDEPVWYAGEDSPHWNVNNDLISVLRTETVFPEVQVNEHRLPEELHVYMTQLSQAVLDEPKPFSTRFKLRIGGKDQYVMFQENAWEDEGRPLQPLLDAAPGPGLTARRSRFAITGKASWTLVPNTGSGVADVLRLPAGDMAGPQVLHRHRRTRKWYTVLTAEGGPLRIDYVDLRPESPEYGRRRVIETVCEPRVSYRIEPGVAYALSTPVEAYVRSENEVFVAEDEPRADLPAFGQDLESLDADSAAFEPSAPPTLKCPDRIVRQMARFELEPQAE